MTRQAAHYQTVSKRDLSERQREVLALIAAEKTNGQIAEALGISLDGAKWHVSEILGKVGVSTREEAAEWWLAQRGLRSRVASFVRLFAPLASWKVAAGAAAAAGVAGVVFAMAPDDPRPRPAAPACLAGNVVAETVEAAGPDGAVIFALTVRSASECSFSGLARIGLGTPASLPFGATLPTSESSVETVIGPTTVAVAYGWWRCTGLAGLPMKVQSFLMTSESAPPLAASAPAYVVTRPACPGVLSEQFDVRPAALSSFFLPALGPEERIFCYADPTWQKQCEQVDRLNLAFLNGLLADAAVRFAEPGDYTCPQPGTGGLGGPARLCEGASAAEVRAGLPVAFHGSEGDVLSISQLREAIAGFLRSGAVRVATIGCPVSGDCDQRFIVGFAVDAQPAAFYLVFESRPNGVALVGAGVAGDIALEIRRGGTAFTSFGETLFTPVTPPY